MRTSLPNRATSFLATLVLLVAMVATAAAADHGKSAKEALEIVVQEVLEGQTEGVWVYATRTPLEAGTLVRGWIQSIPYPPVPGSSSSMTYPAPTGTTPAVTSSLTVPLAT